MRRSVRFGSRRRKRRSRAYWWQLSSCCCCFFFQAEDGIRDYKVTGVQTCALPIYGGGAQLGSDHQLDGLGQQVVVAAVPFLIRRWLAHAVDVRFELDLALRSAPVGEIGRASCRERV